MHANPTMYAPRSFIRIIHMVYIHHMKKKNIAQCVFSRFPIPGSGGVCRISGPDTAFMPNTHPPLFRLCRRHMKPQAIWQLGNSRASSRTKISLKESFGASDATNDEKRGIPGLLRQKKKADNYKIPGFLQVLFSSILATVCTIFSQIPLRNGLGCFRRITPVHPEEV
jgi:hypothetical protein